MSLEAFQDFTNYWYAQVQAQAQAQTQADQSQFFVPPTTPFVLPPTHPIIKLSKLVKKARRLGCENFSCTIDTVVAKNG